jgi:hypothetical protein
VQALTLVDLIHSLAAVDEPTIPSSTLLKARLAILPRRHHQRSLVPVIELPTIDPRFLQETPRAQIPNSQKPPLKTLQKSIHRLYVISPITCDPFHSADEEDLPMRSTTTTMKSKLKQKKLKPTMDTVIDELVVAAVARVVRVEVALDLEDHHHSSSAWDRHHGLVTERVRVQKAMTTLAVHEVAHLVDVGAMDLIITGIAAASLNTTLTDHGLAHLRTERALTLGPSSTLSAHAWV